jgi:EmrB/QacA subfamily drug resistance transporter
MEVFAMKDRVPSPSQVFLATAGVALTLLLSALDQTVVGVAMPRIAAELHGLQFYAWVTTAYLVASTATLPVAGKLGDMFGRKPFLLGGIAGFVGASALCGLSQNLPELVAFRALQGLFGGVLFASTFAVLADIFPPAQLTKMSGVFGAVFGISSLVGPTLGGFLTDGPGWRWAFYVNVPLGVLALVLVASRLPYVRGTGTALRDIDWLGAGLLVSGLAPLLVGLTLTRDHSWLSVQVLGLLGVAAVILAAFVAVERRAAHPVVPLDLFKLNLFALPAVIAFFSAIGMFGTITFVPLVYQGLLSTSATNSGQLLTPMMVAVVLTATPTGALMARVRRYRYIGTAAVGTMILGLLLLAQVGVHSSRWEVTRDIIIIGAGLGVTFPLTIAVVQAGLKHHLVGVGTSQVNFWRSLGGAIGTAVLGAILANGSPGRARAFAAPLQLAATLHGVFLTAAAVAAVALVATLFMREVPLSRKPAMVEEELQAA